MIRLLHQRLYIRFFLLILLFTCMGSLSLFAQKYKGSYFWEYPKILEDENVSFPLAASNNECAAIVYQEISIPDSETWETSFSLLFTDDGQNWKENRNFAGPFSYAGTEAPVTSIAVRNDNEIYVVVSKGDNTLVIFKSTDKGESFAEPVEIFTKGSIAVAPRLFVRSDGGLILYITQKYVQDSDSTEDQLILGRAPLSVYYALSDDGRNWTDFSPLVTENELIDNYNVLPNHSVLNGNDYVVFQSLITKERTTSYQLYLKRSTNGGRTWSRIQPITDAIGIDNQRPVLRALNNSLGLVWERKRLGELYSQIYFMELDSAGSVLKIPEPVTDAPRSHQSPRCFYFSGSIFTVWFDNRGGDNAIFLAERTDLGWEEPDHTNKWLEYIKGISTFAEPVFLNNSIHLFWINSRNENSGQRIVMLSPDQSVPDPVLQAGNFRPGERHKQDIFSFSWNLPDDSSGIDGFSYSLDQNPDGLPPLRIKAFSNIRNTEVTIEEDGTWYFHLGAVDNAGNWSDAVTLSFYRDTTPPEPVLIEPPSFDDEGYTASNTNTFSWKEPEEEYISGYTYVMSYLGPPDTEIDEETAELRTPPNRMLTSVPEVYFRNLDNGLYALSVKPIDTVGNFGEAVTLFLRMNKYIPETYITDLKAPKDLLGRVNLEIRGRGFSVGGLISQVLLDRDGVEPYDYSYSIDSGIYSVENDRYIIGPTIEDIDEGAYRIGLVHPQRGIYFTRSFLEFESSGTIKFGDFRLQEGRQWQFIPRGKISLSINSVVFYLVLAFVGLLMFFSVRRLGALAQEGRALKREVNLLLSIEGPSAVKRKERIQEMKRRGMGLRAKFTLFVTLLVILVVIGVAFPLSLYMIETQRENLVEGLENQTKVLLESMASGARDSIVAKNRLALGLLLQQKSAMQDAVFVTITGPGTPVAEPYDYVWVSDDPDLADKIEGDTVEPEVSLMNDPVASDILQLAEEVNVKAEEEVSLLVAEREKLGADALILARKQDQASRDALSQLQEQLADLENEITDRLFQVGDIIRSYPDFQVGNVSEENSFYVFYKPILGRPTSSESRNYFIGAVRIGVSTDRILQEITDSLRNLITRIGITAAVAIAVGILLSLVLASIIIIPIRRLVRGVEVIRDTEDKEALKEHLIDVKTRDEIAALADTVNQMTMGLVKAAVANKDLTVGKEVQKMFIPLEKDQSGNKASTGSESNDNVEFFGYYEGAKGVSGDYFDFRKLDDKHYAIIKCDVAGKGVPASLIMVEVATIFLNYFRNWSSKKEGIHLDTFVYGINDLLEERGFKGRFAALIVVILNIETGKAYMCNAGDNLVHLFDAGRTEMWTKTLPEAPAAGVFPSMLVEMQSGFQQIAHILNAGDTMFLFTDGIEEAQRRFRNEAFELITCQEAGLEDGEPHGNHVKGSEFEELGIPRIHDIINSVFSKREYRLEKYHNPLANEELVFDFTACGGDVHDAVMALVSVEKIFRLYRDPDAGPEDKIVIDKKIAEFLKRHFNQYDLFFSNQLEEKEETEYLTFTHLKEDEQFDDLTILGIRKK